MTNEHVSADLRPTRWWHWILVYPTLIISLVGAIPSFIDRYQAYKKGVPHQTLWVATEQERLWEKNFDCAKNVPPHVFTTVSNASVNVIGCPSGDILVKVQKPDGPNEFFRWIEFNNALTQTSYLSPGVREAFAASQNPPLDQLAQSGTTVICQRRDANGFIVRIIQFPNGSCEEEVINPFTGAVVSRKSAPCTRC